MTTPMFNPQPNYSGVTIQIANPAVNVTPGLYGMNGNSRCSIPNMRECADFANSEYANYNGYPVFNNYAAPPGTLSQNRHPINNGYIAYPQGSYGSYEQNKLGLTDANTADRTGTQNTTLQSAENNYPNTYPAQYYLNNYNYGVNGNGNGIPNINGASNDNNANELYSATQNIPSRNQQNLSNEGTNQLSRHEINEKQNNLATNNLNDSNQVPNENYEKPNENNMNSYKMYAKADEPKDTDMSRSQNIIGDLDERVSELEEKKKNTKETKIVALTDEYIKSLENYLNNPNDEIRLMASKEILTRLDEDKDRYDDAALNALLNKMMQDPSKLVRIAALSAFASQLASGNDYTVQLLHNIQSNPNADKEDVLQAADILLKMSAGVEVKNIPTPDVKESKIVSNKG